MTGASTLRALAAAALPALLAALAALLASCATARPAPGPAVGGPAAEAAALDAVSARGNAGEFERAFGRQPQTAGDAVLYASLLRQAGRTEESQKVLEDLLAREPRNTDALYALALLQSSPDKQREILDRILAIDPLHADAAAAVGEASRVGGGRDAARELFERALKSDPAHPLALLGLARLAYDAGDFPGAEQRLTQAVDAHPGLSVAWFERARARRRLGDDQGALADLERGLRLEPDDVWGLIDRGRLLLQHGRADEALADFEHATRADPTNFVPLAHAASLHYQAGRWAQARAAFTAVVRLNPDYTAAYPTLGGLAWRLAEYAEAGDWFAQAWERRRREPAYALLSALALRRAGRESAATAGLAGLLPALPRESWYYTTAEFLVRPEWDVPLLERLRGEKNDVLKKRMLFYLGMQYLLMGRRQAAATYLLEAASLEPDDLPEKQLAAWEMEHAN